MESKLLMRFCFVGSLLTLVAGCGPSSSSRQRDAELVELKISNSNLVVQAQEFKLQADKDKSKLESELAEFKTNFNGLNARLQQAQKQAEESKARHEIELQNALRQQETRALASKKKDAAQKVFKELLKLKAATDAGLNYPQYAERLLDTSTTIKVALLDVDDQKFGLAVSEILDAYEDAGMFWRSQIQYKWIKYDDNEKMLLQKYEVLNQETFIVRTSNDFLTIWSFATKKINELANKFPDLLTS